LSQLKERTPAFDVIISDIEMPEMNAYEFARKVRDVECHENIYALLHTSLCVDTNSKDFQNSKAYALLTNSSRKPWLTISIKA